MYNDRTITVIIPCYNEENGLKEVLSGMPSYIDEVIVVDNDSDDDTSAVAMEYGATLLLEKKRGYGSAYQRGLSSPVMNDITVLIDGDNSYPLPEIENLLLHMENNGSDFISGCRFPLPGKYMMPLIKRISNAVISLLVRRTFRIDLVDSQSGMMVFKTCLTDKIFSGNPGMGFSQEIKINAFLDPNIKSEELQINYHPRIGKVKFRPINDGLKVLWDFFMFARKKRV